MPHQPKSQKKSESSKINWDQYGLAGNTSASANAISSQQPIGSQETDYVADEDGLMQGGLPAQNELFRENQDVSGKPWWRANFFVSAPILFGAWDGVFTTCVIHLVGVITFLRAGWIVGNAGIGLSILVVLLCVSVCTISVLAGIGIIERCNHITGGGGNVHYLISHVLGAQLGGAISIIYCFGQAVACALHVMGFAETMAQLMEIDNVWIERMVGIFVVSLLVGINIAGVKWVIRLQFALLFFLFLATIDFTAGIFLRHKPESGVNGFSIANIENNWKPQLGSTSKTNIFTVVGVFFPAVTGVFAGINMSNDLYNPSREIPIGTFTAIASSLFIYLLFMIGLGATCDRNALLTDYLIAQKVSFVGIFLLAGLYISSVSHCLGILYATPRIIQNIAAENIIPILKVFSQGRGPNKVPVLALFFFSLVTFAFIMVGKINILAPIVTIPFLLTYAAIDYAYFSLAMTFDIQINREARFMSGMEISSPTFDKTKSTKHGNYGAVKDGDLDRLFPERVKHQHIVVRRQHSTPSTSGSSPVSSPDDHSSIKSIEETSLKTDDTGSTVDSKADFEIKTKQNAWHAGFTSRWLILFGAVIKIIIMFFVRWEYALSSFLSIAFLWFYIGQASPGAFPGISEFKFFPWIKKILLMCIGKSPSYYDQIVLPPGIPNMNVTSSQLTKESTDYASRDKYHQSAPSQFNTSTSPSLRE